MSKVEKIARNVFIAKTVEEQIKDEIKEDLKAALKESKGFDDKELAKETEKKIKEVAECLGIKL